jgi:hypothetical protein
MQFLEIARPIRRKKKALGRRGPMSHRQGEGLGAGLSEFSTAVELFD